MECYGVQAVNNSYLYLAFTKNVAREQAMPCFVRIALMARGEELRLKEIVLTAGRRAVRALFATVTMFAGNAIGEYLSPTLDAKNSPANYLGGRQYS
jgi:hypothetical protein